MNSNTVRLEAEQYAVINTPHGRSVLPPGCLISPASAVEHRGTWGEIEAEAVKLGLAMPAGGESTRPIDPLRAEALESLAAKAGIKEESIVAEMDRLKAARAEATKGEP